MLVRKAGTSHLQAVLSLGDSAAFSLILSLSLVADDCNGAATAGIQGAHRNGRVQSAEIGSQEPTFDVVASGNFDSKKI